MPSNHVLARFAAKAQADRQNPSGNDATSPQEGTSQGNPKKRPSVDDITGPHQTQKRIQLTNQNPQPDLVRPILSHLENRHKAVVVEIEPGAKWTAGLAHPMQALSVFDLPADAENYANHQPVDLINRARRRFGRFAAEFVHMSNLFEKFEREENRQKLLEETMLLRNEHRQLSARVEELQKESRNLTAAKKTWNDEKVKFMADNQKLLQEKNTWSSKIAELTNEVTSLRETLLEKDRELEQTKKNLSAAELEAESALKDGYILCYEKIQATGVDVAGMSYDDYVSELADQLSKQTLHKEC